MVEMTAFREPAQTKPLLIRMDPVRPPNFESLYQAFAARIYRYFLRRVEGPQEAEDLTAQVFTRALAGWNEYRGGLPAATTRQR